MPFIYLSNIRQLTSKKNQKNFLKGFWKAFL